MQFEAISKEFTNEVKNRFKNDATAEIKENYLDSANFFDKNLSTTT